jgi:hypothetical protein
MLHEYSPAVVAAEIRIIAKAHRDPPSEHREAA